MSHADLVRWEAFYRLEAFGPEADALRLARVAQVAGGGRLLDHAILYRAPAAPPANVADQARAVMTAIMEAQRARKARG